jgi:hypothetical protein
MSAVVTPASSGHSPTSQDYYEEYGSNMGGGGGGAPPTFMEHSHLYHPNGGAHHGSAGIVARRPEMEFLDISLT